MDNTYTESSNEIFNFFSACDEFIDGKFIAFGQGSTKREAEQNSAKKTLTKLNKKS